MKYAFQNKENRKYVANKSTKRNTEKTFVNSW
mgnify:CR=1 FL=1